MNDPRYEDHFGAVARAGHRVLRLVRWHAKGLLRRPRTALLELRWRLGDEIMALPIIDVFQARHPSTRVHVWTNYPELYEGYRVEARGEAPDGAMDRYVFLRDVPRDAYRSERYARLASIPTPSAPPCLRFADWNAPMLPKRSQPLVALARGASWPTKRWPAERWTALSTALRDQGCTVVSMGVTGEAIEADVDLVGRTNVREAACVLHHANLLVCCDSGLMHLALAAGTPVVALFGPTDPDLYVRNQPLFHPLRSSSECAGFWNHSPEVPTAGRCPLGHAVCLESIAVADVLNAAQSCLERNG